MKLPVLEKRCVQILQAVDHQHIKVSYYKVLGVVSEAPTTQRPLMNRFVLISSKIRQKTETLILPRAGTFRCAGRIKAFAF